MIKKLRRYVGGTWTAHREGFNSYRYTGTVDGIEFELKSYAHSIMGINGYEDDRYNTRWHISVDGVEVAQVSPWPTIGFLSGPVDGQYAGPVVMRVSELLAERLRQNSKIKG